MLLIMYIFTYIIAFRPIIKILEWKLESTIALTEYCDLFSIVVFGIFIIIHIIINRGIRYLNYKINNHSISMLLVLSLIILIQCITFPVISNSGLIFDVNNKIFLSPESYFIKNLIKMIFFTSFYIYLGLNMKDIFLLFQMERFKKVIYIMYYIFCLTVIYIAITSTERNIFEGVFRGRNNRGPYLEAGDMFTMLSFFVILYQKKGKWIIFLLSVGISFLIGSRTSLYLLTGIVVMEYFFRIILTKKISLKASLIGVLITGVLIVCTRHFLPSINLNQVKTLELLVNFNLDNSYLGRAARLKSNLPILKENWFFGKYMSDILNRGEVGAYIHNFLSYWQNYGLIPFVMILYMLLYTWYLNTIVYIKNFNETSVRCLWMLSFFIITETLFSRALTFHYLWFMLAYSFSYLQQLFYNERYSHEKNRNFNLSPKY